MHHLPCYYFFADYTAVTVGYQRLRETNTGR